MLFKGDTALGLAVKGGKLDCMKLFIIHGAPLNVKRNDGKNKPFIHFSKITIDEK